MSTSTSELSLEEILATAFFHVQAPAAVVERATTRIVALNAQAEVYLAPHLDGDGTDGGTALADLAVGSAEQLDEDLKLAASGGQLTLRLRPRNGSAPTRLEYRVTPIEPRPGQRFWLLTFAGDRTGNARFGELTARLQRANDLARRERQLNRKLKEDYDVLGRFAQHTAHDMIGPLKNITLCMSLIEAESGDVLDSQTNRLLDLAQAAADRLRTVVEDSLELAMAGNGEIDKESVALDDVVAAVLAENELSLGGVGATVEIESELGTVVADRGLLTRLIDNLVSNAVKYRSAERGLRITIRGSAEDGGRATMLAVADNGQGFDPSAGDRIFEPFVRLHSSKFEGTGVGLATCRTICERHRWTIEAEGRPDEGAEFRIRFGRGRGDRP